jgi:predicted nucleic acid-binding protein
VIAVDTSVVIAAFASWHESHAAAAAVVAEGPALPAPCALEAYAALTRMPPPHRAGPAIVRDFLRHAFSAAHLELPADASSGLVDRLVEAGVSGGASYDAVIAMIADSHGRELVTLDARARSTYERIGVPIRYLVDIHPGQALAP